MPLHFAAAAIDSTSQYFYLRYTKGVFGVVQGEHIVIYDAVLNRYLEFELALKTGSSYGQDSLWVQGGIVSYVAVSDGDIQLYRWDFSEAINKQQWIDLNNSEEL